MSGVHSLSLDGRTSEHPSVVEGALVKVDCTGVDAADTLVVFGDDTRRVFFCDYGVAA